MADRHNLASDHNSAGDRHFANHRDRRGCHRAHRPVDGVRLAVPDGLPGGCGSRRARGNNGQQIVSGIPHSRGHH